MVVIFDDVGEQRANDVPASLRARHPELGNGPASWSRTANTRPHAGSPRRCSWLPAQPTVTPRWTGCARSGRTGLWVKIRQMTVVDAIVIGVTGATEQPTEVILAKRDETGQLRQIGLSLPLAPRLTGADWRARDAHRRTAGAAIDGRVRQRPRALPPCPAHSGSGSGGRSVDRLVHQPTPAPRAPNAIRP